MKVTELFGSNVFTDEIMKNSLPKEVYKSLRKTIDEGQPLDSSIAGAVANAMKDWAVSKGATHYTHWFQPLTNLTASKHDSFIEPSGDKVIMQLTGKSLIVGEPDASSFPSGGTRMTSAARGYTAWDPTSPAFVKEGTLFIPTVFVSYTGETLDKKAPLLKSMTALDAQAKRLLKMFGITCRRVATTVGPEQEYFLIDEDMFNQRKDLILTGRTLFGAPPARGQELEDHYFGVLKTRISDFMRDLDETLWSYGIFAKTKHNEVAPAQHELAPIFTTTNVAVDDNQLTMELMKKVAQKHHMACLLHEKPFEGVNGSGKHNNWSLSTDTGLNLLDPGENPEKNTLFMLVLACVIEAVDTYQGILRASVASAGNDHRLGANEAPPAIISVYLGDQLGALVDSIVLGREYVPKKAVPGSIGVPESPIFPIDTTDRNRTSPFAFTGNKFEFRMLGSQASVADPNIVSIPSSRRPSPRRWMRSPGRRTSRRLAQSTPRSSSKITIASSSTTTATAPTRSTKQSAEACSTTRRPPTPFPSTSNPRTSTCSCARASTPRKKSSRVPTFRLRITSRPSTSKHALCSRWASRTSIPPSTGTSQSSAR